MRALDPQRLFAEYDLIVTVTDVANAVNVSFSDATYDVPEGDSVEVTVTLSADPDQTVVIPLTAAGRGGLEDADYGGVPANVTFSAGGSLEQTFRVTTTDDRIDDDGESLRLTFGTPLPDSVSTTSPSAATVSITDDDVAGVTLSKTSLDIGEGGSGDYTVVLTSEPTADVTIESRAPAGSDLTVNPSSLTFTSGNWESPQTVAVSAADDNDFTDDTGTIRHRVTSGDSDYNNRSVGSVAVTVDGRRGGAGHGQVRLGELHGRRGRHGRRDRDPEPGPEAHGDDSDRYGQPEWRERRRLLRTCPAA